MSDSGIGRNVSSVYGDSMDEQGYLEPINRRSGHQSDPMCGIDDYQDISMMEGSCVDTECYGVDGKAAPINVEKYKIQKAPSSHLSTIPQEPAVCEVEYNEDDMDKLDGQHDYEEIPEKKPFPEMEHDTTFTSDDDYDTIDRIKRGHKKEQVSRGSTPSLNDLNKDENDKCSSDNVHLSRPNIHDGSPASSRSSSGRGREGRRSDRLELLQGGDSVC